MTSQKSELDLPDRRFLSHPVAIMSQGKKVGTTSRNRHGLGMLADDSFERDMKEALNVIHENIRRIEEDKRRHGHQHTTAVSSTFDGQLKQLRKPRSSTLPVHRRAAETTSTKTGGMLATVGSKDRAQTLAGSPIPESNISNNQFPGAAVSAARIGGTQPEKRPVSRKGHFQMLLKAALSEKSST